MPTIYTIGHSTRELEEFGSILRAFSIKNLVDIRTIPRSRKNPQYNSEEFAAWLRSMRVGYFHCRDLGGLRRAQKDSVNVGWRNSSFRGFADYMQTDQFRNAMGELIALAEKRKTVIMCAEAVPWRCHRSLIADALLARGIEVQHIFNERSSKPHALTPWARVEGLQITYPATINANENTPRINAT